MQMCLCLSSYFILILLLLFLLFVFKRDDSTGAASDLFGTQEMPSIGRLIHFCSFVGNFHHSLYIRLNSRDTKPRRLLVSIFFWVYRSVFKDYNIVMNFNLLHLSFSMSSYFGFELSVCPLSLMFRLKI